MSFGLNLAVFLILIGISLRAYQKQSLWLQLVPLSLLKLGENRSFFMQWLIYSPIFVIWLLLCHWLDVKEWHGLAAAGIGIAMIVALQAMRQLEEQQKINLMKGRKE